MHPYLPHLLADMKAAHRELDRVQLSGKENARAFIIEFESWNSGDANHTLGYYLGLKNNDFPPGDQFSEKEVVQICEAFREMVTTWNASIDLPENIPPRRQYELMVGLLEEEFSPMRFGTFHFDFCTGYAPDCELKEYCPCMEFWKEDLPE